MIATSLRVRVKERGLQDGRVSLRAANAVMSALRVALRAGAAALPDHEQLVWFTGIESGNAVLRFESEPGARDVPEAAFECLITEAARPLADGAHGNSEMQRALLQLDVLFDAGSSIEFVEFTSDNGNTAVVTPATVDRIKTALHESRGNSEASAAEGSDTVRPSRFDEQRSIAHISREQGVSPLVHFESLALEDPEEVPIDEFNAFIADVRRPDPTDG